MKGIIAVLLFLFLLFFSGCSFNYYITAGCFSNYYVIVCKKDLCVVKKKKKLPEKNKLKITAVPLNQTGCYVYFVWKIK